MRTHFSVHAAPFADGVRRLLAANKSKFSEGVTQRRLADFARRVFDNGVNGERQPGFRPWGSVALCALLSLLLHASLAWALELFPRHTSGQKRQPLARSVRHLQVVRAEARPEEKPLPKEQQQAQEREAPFAKTSADERQRRPKQADFIGRHDSLASGGPDALQRSSEAPLPTMAGRESEEEVVTFDQKRQDGDLAHEGKAATEPPAPPQPSPAESPQPVAQGEPEGHAEQGEPQGEGSQPPAPAADATAAHEPEPDTSDEGLKLSKLATENALTLPQPQPPPAPLGQPEGRTEQAAASSAPRPFRPRLTPYDPSLADGAQQPGLRTYERRTRSTGRFIFGRRPSLNVAATARGRYEAEIYRRIARVWYAACDEHRGDIIPGSITLSLRLTKSGGIDSMELIRRRGASIIQQSFSFGAIRRASLPPMPTEVQQGIIGTLYEMILTFNFD